MRHSVGLVLTIALGLTAQAQAGIVLDSTFQTSGTPIATIERSADQNVLGGALVQETVYVGPFSVTSPNWITTQPFDAFCVDLWHTMSTSDPGINVVAVSPLNTIKGAPEFNLTSDAGIGNKLAFLMGDYASKTTWSADEKGGFQLVLWSLIDPNFQLVSGEADLASAYAGLLGLFQNTGWGGLTPYSGSTTYGGGTFFQVEHDGDQYQDLVTAQYDPQIGPQSVVPEPATITMLMSSGLVLGLGALIRKRRRGR